MLKGKCYEACLGWWKHWSSKIPQSSDRVQAAALDHAVSAQALAYREKVQRLLQAVQSRTLFKFRPAMPGPGECPPHRSDSRLLISDWED